MVKCYKYVDGMVIETNQKGEDRVVIKNKTLCADIREALIARCLFEAKKRYRIYASIMSLAVIIEIIMIIIWKEISADNIIIITMVVVGLIFAKVFSNTLMEKSALKISKQKFAKEFLQVEFSNKIEIFGQISDIVSIYDYSNIEKYVDYEKFLYLYFPNKLIIPLSKEGFEGGTWQECVQLLDRQYVKKGK